jgi:hypothetical protein
VIKSKVVEEYYFSALGKSSSKKAKLTYKQKSLA